jgi:hypothetical protein
LNNKAFLPTKNKTPSERIIQMSTLPPRAPQPESPNPNPTFWQRPFVQDILPFLTSLTLHLTLIALGILTFKAVQVITQSTQKPTVIPEPLSPISDSSDHPQFQGLDTDETRRSAQDKFLDAPPDSKGLSDQKAMLLSLTRPGGGAGETNDEAIAIGLEKNFGKGKQGLNNGVGEEQGTGDGAYGLAPFGRKGGGIFDAGPRTTHRVNKIVFLCDASGSMMPKFDALRTELRKAIDHLQPTQQFDVIFFSEDTYLALDNQLQYALPESKRKAYDLLDKTAPHSTSDPIPGLRAAFAASPELIFMLTDGDFPNNEKVREEIKKLSASKKVIINTIAFMDRGETYETLLKQIADETRGTFKFVSEQELKP